RPPLACIAAAFAGVSAGYSANLLLGPADIILAGITQESVAIVDAGYQVSIAGNYYFTFVSTFLLSLIGAWVTVRWVEPYLALGQQRDTPPEDSLLHEPQNPLAQTRALRRVGVWTLIFALLVVAAAWGTDAPLRDESGRLLPAALVPLIAFYAAIAGVIFGRVSGRYQRTSECVEGMENAMRTLAGYLVLIFFAAQFVACFSWSNLGVLVANSGASLLSAWEGQSIALLLLFVLISAFINLFVGSASAKWGILAPVFVPMLFLLGIAPEKTQMAYRIGDSATNIITPLMPYFGVVLAFAARYRKDMGVGTMVAMMLPYSLAFLLCWTAFFALWLWLGWPLGVML
ncbi:MAG TPA: AbgT family transporter, partial [Cellvibrionaceae bacterium]